MNKPTAEQRERARSEARELLAAILAGETAPRRKRVAQPRKPRATGVGSAPRPPKYDRKQIVAMFNEGKPISEIAAELGAHRGTVSRALTEAGVEAANRRGPYRKLKECDRGHDMATHWRPNSGASKGGGYCSECKRMRERVEWKRGRDVA